MLRRSVESTDGQGRLGLGQRLAFDKSSTIHHQHQLSSQTSNDLLTLQQRQKLLLCSFPRNDGLQVDHISLRVFSARMYFFEDAISIKAANMVNKTRSLLLQSFSKTNGPRLMYLPH